MKKEVLLKEISLLNFKGVRKLKISFGKETHVFGANATGKTTLADAYNWLFFGKDTQGRSDFEVKTLDSKNNVIPKLDHEVSAIISINGEAIEIRRILREKWSKTKGSLETEFKGNQTEYYWDGVPLKQVDFKIKVSKIIEESVFNLISNPFSFESLKWQDKRNVLLDVVGGVSDEEISKGNPAYEALVKKLSEEKTLDDYKKQVAASVKKAKDEIKLIPSRIDEVDRSKPDALDFQSLEKELQNKQKDLSEVDAKINDASKAFQVELDKVRAKRIEVNNLKSEIELIESNTLKEAEKRCAPDTSDLDSLRSKLTEKEADLKELEKAKETLSKKLQDQKDDIPRIEKAIEEKRNEWHKVNEEAFKIDENECKCPTCNRAFEAEDIEAKKKELEASFNQNKTEKLTRIQNAGKVFSEDLKNVKDFTKTIEERLSKGAEKITSVQSEITSLKEQIEVIDIPTDTQDPTGVYNELIASNKDYEAKAKQLQKLQSEVKEEPKADNEALIKERQEVVNEIDSIKSQLQDKEQIERANERIAELEKQEKELAQQIANVEKEQFTIENFIKHKIDHLESKINAKFKMVNFKMFSEQINGGISETCEALIDGVPFSNANTASKINAGLDIINTLSDYYGISAPVFIDNRESVTDLISIESQIINLIVLEDNSKHSDEDIKLKYYKDLIRIHNNGDVVLGYSLSEAEQFVSKYNKLQEA